MFHNSPIYTEQMSHLDLHLEPYDSTGFPLEAHFYMNK